VAKQGGVLSKRLGSGTGVGRPLVVVPVVRKGGRRGAGYACAKLATNASVASAMGSSPRTGGLIEPDGGVLVDLHVAEGERESKRAEAAALPKVQLARVDLEWVQAVAEGWASPLAGFMRQSEYLQALHFNCLRLPDGSFTNMSLPIVLAIDDEKKESLAGVSAVTLVAPDGNDIAILREYGTELNFSLACLDDFLIFYFFLAEVGVWM
jgi:hypothetical protein